MSGTLDVAPLCTADVLQIRAVGDPMYSSVFPDLSGCTVGSIVADLLMETIDGTLQQLRESYLLGIAEQEIVGAAICNG